MAVLLCRRVEDQVVTAKDWYNIGLCYAYVSEEDQLADTLLKHTIPYFQIAQFAFLAPSY